jgi:hypothetical protein
MPRRRAPWPPPYLQTTAAAARIGRQANTLYKWRHRENYGPPCFQDASGRWLYPIGPLDAWARKHGFAIAGEDGDEAS